MAHAHSLRFIPNFHRVHAPLVELGVDTATVYARVGIRQRDIEDNQVEVCQYLKILELAAKMHDRPFLGLEIAQMRDRADLGLFGYMISNASDYRGLSELANRYLEVITPATVATLIETGPHTLWTYEFPGIHPELCRQDVELSLMEYISITRHALGQHDWRPLEVCFQHAAPEDATPLRQAMTPNIRFDHWCNGALFPRQLLDQRISDADPRLLQLLQDEVRELRDKPHPGADLATNLSLMIASGIRKGEISSDKLAHDLHMSRRSLHRRLAEAGTSVQAVRDAVVARLAREMLSTTRASVAEIASTLGYSESSAFVRSFRRLTGETPGAYRKRHAVGGP